jgi:hypothetical protein
MTDKNNVNANVEASEERERVDIRKLVRVCKEVIDRGGFASEAAEILGITEGTLNARKSQFTAQQIDIAVKGGMDRKEAKKMMKAFLPNFPRNTANKEAMQDFASEIFGLNN